MSNSVTLIGNLTREPEMKYTPSGVAVTKFGIAVNRSYVSANGERKEQTDFFTVNTWRTLAEHCAESLKTGTRVVVTGRVQSRSWETEDGQKRTVVEIEADDVGPSLRFATAQVTKASRGTPGEWGSESNGPGSSSQPQPSSSWGSEQEVSQAGSP